MTNKKRKISVVLACYNGEKYIDEQLRTICEQSLPPDEIIVSDDGSSDRTVQIVHSLNNSKNYPVDIRLVNNTHKHGFVFNFENALFHVTGDYVFLADQDDIWKHDKIEKCIRVFEMNCQATCVIHNWDNIDSNGSIIGGGSHCLIRKMLVFNQDKNVYQVSRDLFLKTSIYSCVALGMALCFKMDFVNQILPFSDSCLHHDMYLPFCSILNDSTFYLDEVLAYHRLHSENTTGTINEEKTVFDNYKRLRRRIIENITQSGHKSRYYSGMKERIELVWNDQDDLKYDEIVVDAYNTISRSLLLAQKQEDIMKSSWYYGLNQIVKTCKETSYYNDNKVKLLLDILSVCLYSKKRRLLMIANS